MHIMAEELTSGRMSTVETLGWIGLVNRIIARVARESDADVVAFVEYWKDILIGPVVGLIGLVRRVGKS